MMEQQNQMFLVTGQYKAKVGRDLSDGRALPALDRYLQRSLDAAVGRIFIGMLCNCKPFPVGIRDHYHKLKSHHITRRVRTAAKIAPLLRNVDLRDKYYVHAFLPIRKS